MFGTNGNLLEDSKTSPIKIPIFLWMIHFTLELEFEIDFNFNFSIDWAEIGTFNLSKNHFERFQRDTIQLSPLLFSFVAIKVRFILFQRSKIILGSND